MATAGLAMLALVAALMVATGLPTWALLVGVAMASAAAGVAGGAFPLPLLESLPSRLTGLLDHDLLQALPLYVLIGALLNRLPLADVLFRCSVRALAGTRAAPMLAGLGLGVLLAPMNGSVGASVAMLARTVQPRLDATGVASERGAALVCVASTLGVVVPPSLVLILLSDAMLRAHTEAVNVTRAAVRIVNTQDIFRGALIPAALLLALCAVLTVRAAKAAPASTSAAIAPARRGDAWMAVMTVAVIGGLLVAVASGYLYAVEAAATGGVALFAFGVATRTLTRAVLRDVLADTISVTGALFALLVGATTFTLVLRAFGTDRWVADVLEHLPGGAPAVLVVVMGSLALCALVLDAFEMIFVVIPVVLPPLLTRVPDATWVAVLTLTVLQASFLVPPLGYAVMMARNRLAHPPPMHRLARALLPYLCAQLVVLALLVAFPGLAWHAD